MDPRASTPRTEVDLPPRRRVGDRGRPARARVPVGGQGAAPLVEASGAIVWPAAISSPVDGLSRSSQFFGAHAESSHRRPRRAV